jgi:hypothetical protein
VSESSSGAREALAARTDAIEEAYEFFLGYAAQGLPSDTGGSQIRQFLQQFATAITGLAAFFTDHIASLQIDPAPYRAFIEVIDRDARSALAAAQMVLAQPSIGSQIVDNLNASIHVRALLTDIFLIDEILKQHIT